jgi:hypothetical protein
MCNHVFMKKEGDFSHQPRPIQQKPLALIAIALLIALVAGTAGFVLGRQTSQKATPVATPVPTAIQARPDTYIRVTSSWIRGGAGAIQTSKTGTVGWFMGDEVVGVSAVLKTGSPVWLEIPISTTQTFYLLKFDYEFLSQRGAEGILSVFFDGEPVFKIDERIEALGVNTAQDIAIGELAPGIHIIGFRLDPFTAKQSVARISSIQLGLLSP